jgi:hypothetical protein
LEEKLAFLRRIAQVMVDSRASLLAWTRALDVARDVLSEQSGSTRAEALILETLRSGLLSRDQAGLLAFAHRSIQDYFAQQAESPDSKSKLAEQRAAN